MGRPFLSNEFMSPVVHVPLPDAQLPSPNSSYLDAPVKWSPSNAFDPDDLPVIEDEFIPFPTPSPTASPSPSPSPPIDSPPPGSEHLQLQGANGETITVPLAYHFDPHSQTVVVTLTRGTPPFVTIVAPGLRNADTGQGRTIPAPGPQEVNQETRPATEVGPGSENTEEHEIVSEEGENTTNPDLDMEDDASSEFDLDPEDYLSDDEEPVLTPPYVTSPVLPPSSLSSDTQPRILSTTFIPHSASHLPRYSSPVTPLLHAY